MVNTFAWPIIRLVQRLAMVLTLGCCVYVVVFLLSKNPENSMTAENIDSPKKAVGLVSPVSVTDMKPFDATLSSQARDIFSLPTVVNPSGNAENTPKGELPSHMKVVGILLSNPSQIVIEDTLANKTYFIDEGHPQAGIKILHVNKDQMIINYQGQDIAVPITKD